MSHQCFIKIHGTRKATIDLPVSYPVYRKYLKISFVTKLCYTLKKIYSKYQTGFRKGFNPPTGSDDRKIQEVFRSRACICCVTYGSV